MKFEVRHNSQYRELIISDGNFTYETGLLTENEASELISDLLRVIDELKQ